MILSWDIGDKQGRGRDGWLSSDMFVYEVDSGSVVLVSFCQLDRISQQRKGTSAANCLHHTGLRACLWQVFLTADLYGRDHQPTVDSVTLGRSSWVAWKTNWAKSGKAIQWAELFHGFCLSVLLCFPQQRTIKCKPTQPFPTYLSSVVFHSDQKVN